MKRDLAPAEAAAPAAAAVAQAAGAPGAAAAQAVPVPQAATGPVLRRGVVQAVVASGQVEAPHRLDVGVPITGTVLRNPVTEGQASQRLASTLASINPGGNASTGAVELNSEHGTTVLVVTPSVALSERSDRTIEVIDGRVKQ